FLTSGSGTDRGDFISVRNESNVPTEWTEYSFELPAGTQYFAVRYNKLAGYAFLVDDFSFEAASRDSRLVQDGCRIYRDCEPIAHIRNSYSYVDADYKDGAYYHITAMYTAGESDPSDLMIPTETATTGFDAANIIVRANAIEIYNPYGMEVTVADTSGRIVVGGSTSPIVTASLTSGIYLVKVGSTTTKVIIR
ncbi:MAG: T9SS type A sorting domain-containing protein, partial [Muribaculum sp.]|nr:T9SS type A sorting domain-containing protein [Muribaculum sp.]